jgi:hypothetical protein
VIAVAFGCGDALLDQLAAYEAERPACLGE